MKTGSKRIRIRLNDDGKRRLRMLISVLLLMFSFYLFAGPVLHVQSYAPVRTRAYKVVSGDTLWDIASNTDSNKDIREVIYDICEISGNDSSIVTEGRVIYLPVYK